jgi:hypothetical protein
MYITSLSLGSGDTPLASVVDTINANIQNGNITNFTEVEAFVSNPSSTPDKYDGLRFKNGDDVLVELTGFPAVSSARVYSDSTHYYTVGTSTIVGKYSYPVQLVCCKQGTLVRFSTSQTGSVTAWLLFAKTKNGQTAVGFKNDSSGLWPCYVIAYGDDYNYTKQNLSPAYSPNYSAYVPLPTNFQSNSPNYTDGTYFLAYSQFVNANNGQQSAYSGAVELNGIKGYTDGALFIVDQ